MQLLALYWIFLKIGLFTIGGGLAMLPLMQKELVAGGYMTVQETVDMVAISQMTPGPFAVNAATFAGMNLCGAAGAAVATLGVVTPSVVITVVVTKFFLTFAQKTPVQGALSGVRPVVTGLILSAALHIGYESLLGGGAAVDIPSLLLACVSLCLLLTVKKLSPIMLIAACGVFGAVFLR